MKPTLLFDLDGTITDPKPGIVASFRHALAALGLKAPSPDGLDWIIGPPLRMSFPEAGVPAHQVEAALGHYRTFYAAGAMFEAPVYPGMTEALDAFAAAGFRLIVATSKAHVFARPILAHFGLSNRFVAIHGAELDGRHDDKGDLIAHILETEGGEPASTVMIGDRKFDVLAAKRHGIRTIGVLWGYGGEAELRQAGADILCERPDLLVGKLLSL